MTRTKSGTETDFVADAKSRGAGPFASVWDAIEATPAEAQTLKLRSTLMMALEQHIIAQGWTQAEAARRLGVTQPRISDLLRGKIGLFGLDSLVTLALTAGLHVSIAVNEAA